ncbi:hypothetical protein [Nonomuraea sp. NPDC046570]|uniref:hypothetical protein n=1 Tax=Nonomuraea sp. NPDC046570 TaxID=3155255 RepID=UPI0033E6BFC6
MKRLLIAAALTLAVAGCGQAQSGSGGVASVTGAQGKATATPSATADPREQAVKYAKCMRENGVDMPDPQPGTKGGINLKIGKNDDKSKVRKAMESCRHLAPFMDKGKLDDPKLVEQARALAKCMRENGVDMPDPSPGGGAIQLRNVKPDDPRFKKAMEACKGLGPMAGRS